MNKNIQDLKKFHVEQLGEYACGLACLSALTKYYGGEVTQEQLREISGTTANGTSLLGLLQAAKQVGFDASGFEVDLAHLKKLESPVVLHVVIDSNREHFVVCYGYEQDKFLIGDPAWGVVPYSEEELAAVWQSKALLLPVPGEKFQTRKQSKMGQWKWFVSLIQQDVPVLTVATVLGTVMAVTGLSTAIFSQRLIDDFLPNQEFQKAILGVVALGLLLMFRAVLGYINGVFMARQGRDLNIRIVISFVGLLLKLPMAYFRSYSTGDLIARMNDSLRIRNTVALITGSVIINMLVILVSLAFVFYQSVLMGWLCLTGMAVFLFIGWRYHRPILAGQKEVMAAHSQNESQYVDSLSGMQVLRSYGKEQVFQKRIEGVYAFYQGKAYELALVGNGFSFWSQLTVGLFLSLLFGVGVYLVFEENLLLGELMSLVTVGSTIIPAVAGLVVANMQFQEARVAFDRLYELAELRQEEDVSGDSAKVVRQAPLLELEDIVFRYPGRSALLNGFDLTIRKGEHLTLFAAVGVGKSTVVDLIQRFYEPESGGIRLEGRPAAEVPLDTWRASLGVVNQKEKLFNSTILDNIALSNEGQDVELAVRQLREMNLERFFDQFPQGLMTLCGEEGRNLSAGQRQLVGIVRALIRKPRLLILDEATSAMDFSLEGKILGAIKTYLDIYGTGLLMITHQASLAARGDRILLLEQGKNQGVGSHDELLNFDNTYSRIWKEVITPNS